MVHDPLRRRLLDLGQKSGGHHAFGPPPSMAKMRCGTVVPNFDATISASQWMPPPVHRPVASHPS